MIAKKIKLLILVKHIDGGTGTFILQLLNLENIFQHKLDLSIIVLEKQKYRQINFSEVKIKYFSETHIYPQYYSFIFYLVTFIREILWLKKEVKEINPNVIISVDSHCNLLSSVLKNFFGFDYKIILTFHNNISAVAKVKLSRLLSFLLKLIGGMCFRNADELIGVSKGVSKNIKQYFHLPNNIKTISYGINHNQLNTLKEENIRLPLEFTNKNTRVLISVGRFEKQKDFVTLIKAFKLVHDLNNKVRLLLIGDGNDRNKIVNLVNKVELQKDVFFSGWGKNIPAYLKKSDIFILSSFYEGFPFILLEAMSQGLPTISTNAPFGPSEVLDNGKYGILVPVGNEKVMAEKIIELLTDKNKYKYYAQKALERSKFFSEEKMLRKYIELISRLCNSKQN